MNIEQCSLCVYVRVDIVCDVGDESLQIFRIKRKEGRTISELVLECFQVTFIGQCMLVDRSEITSSEEQTNHSVGRHRDGSTETWAPLHFTQYSGQIPVTIETLSPSKLGHLEVLYMDINVWKKYVTTFFTTEMISDNVGRLCTQSNECGYSKCWLVITAKWPFITIPFLRFYWQLQGLSPLPPTRSST